MAYGFGNGADTVYSRTSGFSYFKDLMASATPGDPAAYEAVQRLNQHAQCIARAATDLPPEFRAGPERRAAGSETRVNPNRVDGQGGYFVPPLWVIDEWVALLRAGRATANRCNVKPLPPGTDSINLPKLATGTTTAVQGTDAAAVSSTDFTDTFVTGPVRTIAGQQDMALQLLEQSPAGIDEIIFGDLIGDYNQKLDLQVLSGSGTSGQLKGIFNAGPTAVTFTSASPTVPLLYTPLTQGLSQVAKSRFQPADTIVMHPSRWYWIVAALDTQNRPLVTPEGGSGANTIAVLDAEAVEGVAGSIAGVPIVVDANLPTNVGAGTNQDRLLVGRLKDNYLYEGALRTRALVEVLSGTLQVRLQVYNYVAQIPDRYPVAYATIDGTGLIMPAGY
jgi:HK97 family phage major capsid protein